MKPQLYKSQTIIDHQQEMIEVIEESLLYHKEYFGGGTPTWTYKGYNTFGITSPSTLFHQLYLELREIVKENVSSERMWMQSWINYHEDQKVLGWHSHSWPIHGYISIRPHKSRTVFRDYEVVNEIGNIYIGEGNKEHMVVIDEDFDTPRITIGYDILLESDLTEVRDNMGLIPF
jgi:hypothetical protein